MPCVQEVRLLSKNDCGLHKNAGNQYGSPLCSCRDRSDGGILYVDGDLNKKFATVLKKIVVRSLDKILQLWYYNCNIGNAMKEIFLGLIVSESRRSLRVGTESPANSDS